MKSDFGTQPVAGGPLGYAILWMNAMLVIGFALTVRVLNGQRRAPAPSALDAPDATERKQTLLGRRARR